MLTRDQVALCYELVLGRQPESEQVLEDQMEAGSVRDLIAAMLVSDEYLTLRTASRAEAGQEKPTDREIEVAAVLLRGETPVEEDFEIGRQSVSHRSWLTRILENRTGVASVQPVLVPAAVVRKHTRSTRERHRGAEYLAPRDLSRSDTDPAHVILIGGCVFDAWSGVLGDLYGTIAVDRVLINNTSVLPAVEASYLESCDFQLLQVPLRSILPEGEYMRLAFDDEAGHRALFDACVGRLSLFLEEASAWSKDVLTFVMNYQRPQASPIGRFAPRYKLSNPIFFIEELNRALDALVATRANCHMLDLDHIAGTFGRRLVQDDLLWLFNHGGTISDFDFEYDRERMEPVPALSDHHDFKVPAFVDAVWGEACAMWRTLRGIDSVKMICVDLDDTLWRGIAAERTEFDGLTVEGWPLGVVEALSFLKKRGIILTIVSKNHPDLVGHLWGMQIGSRFSLDDFAIRKVGWRPKTETIREAIAEANILPDSVVFLDDNPVERASVETAIPGIRVVGPSHYYWRRILLWSSETQVPTITAESAARNAMVGAQVARDQSKSTLSRAEFLASLGLVVALHPIRSTQDPRFARAFELLNKTNQFNTTGKRHTLVECDAYFRRGGIWAAVEASDSFVSYGLIAVMLIDGGHIDQFVMSCRVVGLEVEIAAMSHVAAIIDDNAVEDWSATSLETAANRLSRDLYARIGWTAGEDGVWRGTTFPAVPDHITLAPDQNARVGKPDDALG